jgi:hypothetical protein
MSEYTATDAWRLARWEWSRLDNDRDAVIEVWPDLPEDPDDLPGWLEERPELLKLVRSFGPEDLEGDPPDTLANALGRRFTVHARREVATWVDAPEGADLGYQDLADLLRDPPEIPGWIVEGMIPRGDLTFFVSDGGIGKSWLLMTLAETLRCGGQAFLGQYTEPCNVVFLDMELSAAWYVNRVKMVHRGLEDRGLIPNDRPPGYAIKYLERPALRFDDAPAFLQRNGRPADPQQEPDVFSFDYLKAVIEQTDAGALIIDPIASLWGDTEENSANETTQVLDALKELARVTGAAVVIAHHTNKSRTEERGSTAIRNAAAAMYILKIPNDPPVDGLRILETNKTRHSAPLPKARLCFTWLDGTFTIEQMTQADIEALQEDREAQELERNTEAVLDAIRSAGQFELNKKGLTESLQGEGLSRRDATEAIEAARARGLVETRKGPYNADMYGVR